MNDSKFKRNSRSYPLDLTHVCGSRYFSKEAYIALRSILGLEKRTEWKISPSGVIWNASPSFQESTDICPGWKLKDSQKKIVWDKMHREETVRMEKRDMGRKLHKTTFGNQTSYWLRPRQWQRKVATICRFSIFSTRIGYLISNNMGDKLCPYKARICTQSLITILSPDEKLNVVLNISIVFRSKLP